MRTVKKILASLIVLSPIIFYLFFGVILLILIHADKTSFGVVFFFFVFYFVPFLSTVALGIINLIIKLFVWAENTLEE